MAISTLNKAKMAKVQARVKEVKDVSN